MMPRMVNVRNGPNEETSLADQRRYERPAAEACHGDARYEAALVGEPLDERRDGHDVAEAYAGAGDEAVGQVEEHEAARGETGQEDPDPVEGAGRQGHDAWSHVTHPQTAHEGGETEGEDSDAERRVHRGSRGSAVRLRQRVGEHAPRVDRPKSDLHYDAGYGYDRPIARARTANCFACHLTPPLRTLFPTNTAIDVPARTV